MKNLYLVEPWTEPAEIKTPVQFISVGFGTGLMEE